MLLDLNLPGLDGRDVLRRIKQDEELRTIPVIVLTTSSNPQDVIECYRQGARSYQTRIINFPDFKAALPLMFTYWFRAVTLPVSIEE